MPAAQPRRKNADPEDSAAPLAAATTARRVQPFTSPTARLADELAVPAPSPVHQLQAELLQRTALAEVEAEAPYAGWFRLAFPLASSALLWAGILWGVGNLLA